MFDSSTQALCLHSRPYRETSLLVDIFTEQYGCITAVAKGVKRRSKKSGAGTALQAFRLLEIRLSGKSELKILIHHEQLAHSSGLNSLGLKGNYLYAGLYLNELLLRLLPKEYPYPLLFDAYHEALNQLAKQDNMEVCLRRFEFLLLEELGYGIPFVEVSAQGQWLSDQFLDKEYYYFQNESGFIRCQNKPSARLSVFSGSSLNAIKLENFSDEANLLAAKKLIRLVMQPLLGSKPLQSRQLFS